MTKFTVIDIPYIDKVSDYYKKLIKLPGFILLESTDVIRGRYDILSACPYDVLSTEHFTANAFLDALQRNIPLVDYQLDLPFQGGGIGFFSYDFGCELAGITSDQAALVNLPKAVVGLYDWAIITDHHLKKISLFAAHTQVETVAIVEDVLLRWHSQDCKIEGFVPKKSFTPLVTKAVYEEAFYTIHQALRHGRCYQVNYTQPFKAAYQGEPWAIYNKIKAYNPVPFSAFMTIGDVSILSFSPERFIKLEQGNLLTSPIKGTKPRGASEAEDRALKQLLSTCPKNRAENIMIVDLMRNDLSKIAKVGSVQVPALCAVESYQAVHHLVSHIIAECADIVSPIAAFANCFPGGSITGAPKREAMHIIAEQEAYQRGVYCGSVGYFSAHGSFDTNIAIRTLIAADNSLYLASGGGIVIDSVCEEEYEECFTKIAAILRGL
ncbi:para-aminobenzoate synthase, component I [Legionella beliardensis]|uniref:aminodeoxychorismate synthase n=1 Tax=Legionella beliardensis TaxID=91822 RepID=A0A378I374_9GAMM|nr:aminodeoxychorismate synthase component I [Legionella beliardensis]STX29141.1 para-aminobenzoate synthase, component I [Legionella beliardensis]